MRIAKLSSRETPRRRTFKIVTNSHEPIDLDVTLEYIPPATLNDKQEQERTRIIGQRRYNHLDELANQAREIESAYNSLVASRIVKIDGMTLRKLACLINLDDEAVKEVLAAMKELDPANAERGIHASIPLDPSDSTPLSADERRVFGYPESVGTRGQAATESILYLLNESSWFRDTIATMIQDVSYFQDKDWEAQLKN